MNDDDAQLLLDRLAAGLPEPVTAPVAELIRQGQSARRRQRRTALGGVVLAVALVAAGIALLPGLGSDSPDPAPSDGMPAPPRGMRWVGYGNQVIAVPRSWTTNDAPCNVPQSDTVYLALLGEFFCDTPAQVPGASSVRISPIANGPAFTVNAPDLVLVERIQNSRREVPAGWTTVPWRLSGSVTNLLRQVRAAGLEAEIVKQYVPEPEDGQAHTIPSSGSPVRRGTAITLVIQVHRQMVIRQAVAGSGAEIDVLFPEGTLRGGHYVMSRRTHSGFIDEFQLSAVVTGGSGTPTWQPIAERLRAGDMAVRGLGPDRVVVPEVAEPGTYRVCVENTTQPLCDMLTVVE